MTNTAMTASPVPPADRDDEPLPFDAPPDASDDEMFEEMIA